MFSIRDWRTLIDRTGEDVSAALHRPIQAICPFGFEVFRGRSYQFAGLRRFYCYVGSPRFGADEATWIEDLFAQALHARLYRDFGDIAADFVAYRTGSGVHFTRAVETPIPSHSRVVSICFRSTQDLLRDYARYVLCAIEGICSGTLPEVRHFGDDQVARNRVFQFYLMEEEIFSNIVIPRSGDEEQLRVRLFRQDNRIEYVLHKELSPPASDDEWHLLHGLVKRRLELIRQAVRGGSRGEREVLHSQTFHGQAEIAMEIARPISEAALDFVCTSYREFDHAGSVGVHARH